MKLLKRGLLTEELLKKLSYLSFSHEVREINALLTKSTRQFKKFLFLAFFVDLVNTFFTFLILVFLPKIFKLSPELLLDFVVIFVLFQFAVLSIRSKKLKAFFQYFSVTQDVSDNLISSIFDDYKLSLGENLPGYVSVKKMSRDFANASKSLIEFLRFVKEFLAFVLGTLVLIIYAHFFHEQSYTTLAYLMIGILALYILHAFLDGVHFIYDKDYIKATSSYDRAFRFTAPLLTRTVLSFDESEYLARLKNVASLSATKQKVELVFKSLLPAFLLLIPVLTNDINNGLFYLLVGIFTSSKLFQIKDVVKNKHFVDLGYRRLAQLENYLNQTLEYSSEVTPHGYNRMKASYIEKHRKARVDDNLVWGNVSLENLNYTSGRGKFAKQVFVDDTILPAGKVSILLGDKNVGKSLFGRLLTLRFSIFEAEKVAVGAKDIRTFTSIDSGLKYLHYSELRDIDTSYRNVMSMYIHERLYENYFTEDIFNNFDEFEKVKKYFSRNENHYLPILEFLMPLFERDDILLGIDDIQEGYPKLVRELFQNLNSEFPLTRVLSDLEDTHGRNVIEKGMLYAAIAEYLAYTHLKKYVPEASVAFMDVNLSLPPITKEMRLRFLYAIDIFTAGLIFVVDEPFTNLETPHAKNIFKDFIDYAKAYNAVVLILDEKLNSKIVDEYKGKDVLGKLLQFEEDDYVLKIKNSNLDSL